MCEAALFRNGIERLGAACNGSSRISCANRYSAASYAFRLWGQCTVRTYLVVLDETEESEVALRFAARRAARTGGAVEILVLIRRQEFVAWGGVQATIESEALANAEALVERATAMLGTDLGQRPEFKVRQGDPIASIRDTLAENSEIGALVLGAAKSGSPGPLVAHFAGADSGSLPCPVMIIPGSLSREALDRLS
jgi:nucleotide-binding universal stress UspA family protein